MPFVSYLVRGLLLLLVSKVSDFMFPSECVLGNFFLYFLITDSWLFFSKSKNSWHFYLIVEYGLCCKMHKISWHSNSCAILSTNRNGMESGSSKEKLQELLFLISISLCNEYVEKWNYRSLCPRSSNCWWVNLNSCV